MKKTHNEKETMEYFYDRLNLALFLASERGMRRRRINVFFRRSVLEERIESFLFLGGKRGSNSNGTQFT